MHSMHLLHIYERLISDQNLSNNKLFFNPDGSVNRNELYAIMAKYDISKGELKSAINSCATNTLLNKYNTAITPVASMTVEDLIITTISAKFNADNTLREPEDHWNGDNPPTNPEYLDARDLVWRPIPVGGYFPYESKLSYLPMCTNATNLTSFATYGLVCMQNKVMIGVRKSIKINNVWTYHYGFLIVDQYGGLQEIYPFLEEDNSDNELDGLFKYGNRLYGSTWSGDWSSLRSIKVPAASDTDMVVELDPYIGPPDLPDYSIESGITYSLIGTKVYMFTHARNVNDYYDHKYVIYSYDLGTHEISEPVLMPALSQFYAVSMSYVLTPTRALLPNSGEATLCCLDIPTQQIIWEMDFPAPYHQIMSPNYSFDPIHNYLYLLSNDTLVRLTYE